jgi:ABC-type branched-subunit amino acid transport system ATPase component
MHLAQRGYVMDKGAVSAELDGAAVTSQETLIRYLSV